MLHCVNRNKHWPNVRGHGIENYFCSIKNLWPSPSFCWSRCRREEVHAFEILSRLLNCINSITLCHRKEVRRCVLAKMNYIVSTVTLVKFRVIWRPLSKGQHKSGWLWPHLWGVVLIADWCWRPRPLWAAPSLLGWAWTIRESWLHRNQWARQRVARQPHSPRSIMGKQHSVITQSTVGGACSLFLSWLMRKQRKLEVEVSSVITLKGPPHDPPSLSTPLASEVQQPPQTEPGAEAQVFKHVNL